LPSFSDSQVNIRFGEQQLVFDTALGGRAISWNYKGIELLGSSGADPVEFGFYPMLPWAGRLADNSVSVNGELIQQVITYHGWAIHGLSYENPLTSWSVHTNDNSTTFLAVQRISGWMEALEATFTWTIDEYSLNTTIEVKPMSEASSRVVLGWHPWFRKSLGVGSPAMLRIDGAQLLTKVDSLPTGELVDFDITTGPFDDALIVANKTVVIEWPEAMQLRITNSHDWFVIYDGNKDFICVEPQTGAPNALNGAFSDSALLCSQSEPARMTTRWELRIPSDSLNG
jgi:aldose 1-epimerase